MQFVVVWSSYYYHLVVWILIVASSVSNYPLQSKKKTMFIRSVMPGTVCYCMLLYVTVYYCGKNVARDVEIVRDSDDCIYFLKKIKSCDKKVLYKYQEDLY